MEAGYTLKQGKYISLLEDGFIPVETYCEVPVQEQLIKKVSEKIGSNLPIYFKDIDKNEGSIVYDVMSATIVTYLQIVNELDKDHLIERRN